MYTEDTDAGTIMFHYDIESLYRNTAVLILYQANYWNRDGGETSVDELAMTENDRSFFDKVLRDAFDDVFMPLSVYGKYVVDPHYPYQFNVDVDDDGEMEVAYTLKMPDSWGSHMKAVLDNKISDAIQLYIVKEWFRYITQLELYRYCEQDYYKKVSEMRSALLYRNTPAKKKYNIL